MEGMAITKTVAIKFIIPIEEADQLYWDLDRVFANRLPMLPNNAENRNLTVPTLQRFYDILFDRLGGNRDDMQGMREHD